MEALKSLICCCGSRNGGKESPEPQIYVDSEEHVIPNEESPLIPPDLDNPSYIDEPFNKKLQERLSTVVRAKEGKMVNLGSQIPFNLHNRTLVSDRTVSRSASGSLDPQPPFSSEPFIDATGGNRRYGAQKVPRWMESRSPSPSHDLEELEQESSRSSRFEPVAEQPKPTAPLGVKLVNYTGPTGMTSRGRARERPGHVSQTSMSPPQKRGSGEAKEGEELAGVSGKPIASKKPLVELDDASSIVMSWGD